MGTRAGVKERGEGYTRVGANLTMYRSYPMSNKNGRDIPRFLMYKDLHQRQLVGFIPCALVGDLSLNGRSINNGRRL
jgi:hypothetical protein